MSSHQKEPLMPTESPLYPFQKVAADYFEMKNYHYLVYVDRYSGWNRTCWFPPAESTLAKLIKVLWEEFATMAVHEQMSCDKGINLTSHELNECLKGWGVKFCELSAWYPWSNGHLLL